jgi:hypothetical protein
MPGGTEKNHESTDSGLAGGLNTDFVECEARILVAFVLISLQEYLQKGENSRAQSKGLEH